MAMDKNRLGDAIWAAIKATYGAYMPAMTSQYDTLGRDLWRAVADEIISEIDTNADIVLATDDITIQPGTFKDSLNAPITGQGLQVAVTLNGKIE